MSEHKRGSWVQVWGQVADEACHPEDVPVELFSHNEQFVAYVRADRVTAPTEQPGWIPRCINLTETSIGYLWRCELHAGHDGDHHANSGLFWRDDQSAGYLEAR